MSLSSGSSPLTLSADVFNPTVPPTGTGCVECELENGWWFHLRRCAACGHIGCCDTSPSQHATGHFESTGHPLIRSYEPDESWYWDYRTQNIIQPAEMLPPLTPPLHHPVSQSVPGPKDRVPTDWQAYLNQ